MDLLQAVVTLATNKSLAGPLQDYTVVSPSQVSRIARSLASIPPNAIPIPSEAKV
jgi:hypothetical protein